MMAVFSFILTRGIIYQNSISRFCVENRLQYGMCVYWQLLF